MKGAALGIGFIPLVDAAPLVIAHELGFAREEGLRLDLKRAPSWSTLRDMLVLGQTEAAHMLAPIPIAMALGLGSMATKLDALMVLSMNGNVVGISNELAGKMRADGYGFDFDDAASAGRALIAAAGGRPRIAVPFPFSMHAELLYYWLAALGFSAPQAIDVRIIPPPLMADAMAAGEIDAFCVGAPWGSIVVDQGVGELLLPTAAIWKFAPEKVLAVRHDWAANEPDLTGRLMRAVWRAARWLGDPSNLTTAADILAREAYINVSSEIIERSLTGRMIISQQGDTRMGPSNMEFFAGAANFPWRSQAAWIGEQLASRAGLERETSMRKASDVFRPDLYRANLRNVGAELPGASQKLEGALSAPTAVASESGKLILRPDAFFDGRIFDPDFAE
ncbi:MAG: NitT/TauT family transport system ATP-binding protein [Halocynthiibacter sp.]|jgi:ABC-type nitrate/sulfonate/bicarbonate transport system substrate-binding protein